MQYPPELGIGPQLSLYWNLPKVSWLCRILLETKYCPQFFRVLGRTLQHLGSFNYPSQIVQFWAIFFFKLGNSGSLALTYFWVDLSLDLTKLSTDLKMSSCIMLIYFNLILTVLLTVSFFYIHMFLRTSSVCGVSIQHWKHLNC